MSTEPQTPQNPTQHTNSTTTDDSGTPHYQHIHITSLNTDIIIRQLPSEGLSFQLWPAATAFFSLLDTNQFYSYLNTNPSVPLRVLELGSGTGLVGIAAAAILGADVTVTDLPHVIPNLEFNVSANAGIISRGGGTVVAKEMSWGNVEQMEVVAKLKEFDVVLGSDVVYHDHLYEPLLETLKYFLMTGKGEGKKEVVFLMAHLKRWKKEGVFFKKARKFFEVDVIHRESASHGKRVGVVVYRFVGKQRLCCSSSSALPKLDKLSLIMQVSLLLMPKSFGKNGFFATPMLTKRERSA